jgi:hypothetical protein
MQVTAEVLGCEIEAAPGERLGDCNPAEIVETLQKHGWIYFTGFEVTLDEFQEFTKRFGKCTTPRQVHYPPGGVALGFHGEDCYNPWRPDALWFLNLAEGTHGGTPTGVVDGVRLLEGMDSEWRTFSIENGLRFDREWSAEHWQGIVGGDKQAELTPFLDRLPDVTYEFLPDGTLKTTYRTTMVCRTQSGDLSFSNTILHAVKDPEFYGMHLEDGSEVPQELVSHVEEVCLDMEEGVGWAAGNVALLDNYRLMHRRGEYPGKGRDLRALHGEELFGSTLPTVTTEAEAKLKWLFQGED